MSELITGPHGLKSVICECGRTKREMQSFCGKCYYALPQRVRRALYSRIGGGYEEAHAEARKILKGEA